MVHHRLVEDLRPLRKATVNNLAHPADAVFVATAVALDHLEIGQGHRLREAIADPRQHRMEIRRRGVHHEQRRELQAGGLVEEHLLQAVEQFGLIAGGGGNAPLSLASLDSSPVNGGAKPPRDDSETRLRRAPRARHVSIRPAAHRDPRQCRIGKIDARP